MPDLFFLIEFPIFRELEGDDIDALAPLCEERAYPDGTKVVREGEPADAMYVVKEGVLDVSRQGKHINVLSAGEFFGEMALIDGSPRSADVDAKGDAVLVRLSTEAWRRLKKEKPATALRIADVLLKTLSFRVRRSTARALSSEEAAALAKAEAEQAKAAAAPAPVSSPAPRTKPRAKRKGKGKPRGKLKAKLKAKSGKPSVKRGAAKRKRG